MQGLVTNYSKERINDLIFNGSAITFPSTLYLGAFTTEIDGNGTGTEVSGNGYTRITVSFTTSGDSRSNTAELSFPEATGTWGTVSHFGLIDAASGGNILASFEIPSDQIRNIVSGDQIDIPIGELIFSITGRLTSYAREIVNDVFLNAATTTFPSTLYIGLFTTDITDAGVGTEVSGFNYARRTVTFTTSGTSRSNTAQMLYPTFSAGANFTISHAGLIDASTGGNIIASFELATAKLFEGGSQPKFNIGSLSSSASDA